MRKKKVSIESLSAEMLIMQITIQKEIIENQRILLEDAAREIVELKEKLDVKILDKKIPIRELKIHTFPMRGASSKK